MPRTQPPDDYYKEPPERDCCYWCLHWNYQRNRCGKTGRIADAIDWCESFEFEEEEKTK